MIKLIIVINSYITYSISLALMMPFNSYYCYLHFIAEQIDSQRDELPRFEEEGLGFEPMPSDFKPCFQPLSTVQIFLCSSQKFQ